MMDGLWVRIDYTNHRGERSKYRILPQEISFMTSKWHDGNQWILKAYDENKGEREFAMCDIHSWINLT